MRVGSLCSGYGGLDLGLELALGEPLEHAWHVEYDRWPAAILAHRFPDVPNHGDITKVDWSKVPRVDWLTAGFPCQDLSHAGKRAGIKPGNRSGIWFHVAYGISQLRPANVLIENVRGLLSGTADREVEPRDDGVDGTGPGPVRAIGVVLGDLADLGYDARWGVVRASDAGAPHGRARVFIIATDTDDRESHLGTSADGPFDEWSATRGPVLRAGGRAASNSNGFGGDGTWLHGQGERRRTEPAHGDRLAPDTDSDGQQGIGRLVTDGCDLDGRGRADVAWGAYEPAIRRWERILGRSAPRPTEPAARGTGERLSPTFVEWMMGLPAGWVTAVPGVPKNAQLKALGNGVVPQQAALALAMLGVGQAVVPPPASGKLLSTPLAADGGLDRGSSAGWGLRNESRAIARGMYGVLAR